MLLRLRQDALPSSKLLFFAKKGDADQNVLKTIQYSNTFILEEDLSRSLSRAPAPAGRTGGGARVEHPDDNSAIVLLGRT